MLKLLVCHCSIKRLLNVSAGTAYTDSCDCFANYIRNMNYNIKLTVISINCKNCPIGCPYNLFLRFPPLRFVAGFSSSVFSTPVFLTVPGFPVSRFQSPRLLYLCHRCSKVSIPVWRITSQSYTIVICAIRRVENDFVAQIFNLARPPHAGLSLINMVKLSLVIGRLICLLLTCFCSVRFLTTTLCLIKK